MLSIVLLCVGSGLRAQNAIDTYFEKYNDDDRFTRVSVSSRMFGLFVNFEMDDPDEQELVETISKLKGLKMLIGENVTDAKSIYKEASKLPEGKMEELMSVKNKDNEFRFYITETNGIISELLMVGYEDNQLFILSVVGEIDLRQLSALSQKMDLDGFEHLKNISH